MDLKSFTETLRNMMYERFPYEDDALTMKKHKNRSRHIKDIAFMNLPYFVNENTASFDIGSYIAESKYPYYHILQDAPVIRKRGRGTDKTRGSQRLVGNKALRDYNKVSFNGKTYTREYEKNIRGKRASVLTNTILKSGGNSYFNIHYKYIDNILDVVVPQVAIMYGGIYVGKHGTSLAVDYQAQELANWLEESIDSTDFDYDYGDELWEHLQ